MKKILQIFVIWENGRTLENKIMQDIAAKYDILQTFTISWPAAEFAQNLSRFYGKKIPPAAKKKKNAAPAPSHSLWAMTTTPIW